MWIVLMQQLYLLSQHRFNLSIEMLRGQCYDVSTMSGNRSRVAKRISELELRALFTPAMGMH